MRDCHFKSFYFQGEKGLLARKQRRMATEMWSNKSIHQHRHTIQLTWRVLLYLQFSVAIFQFVNKWLNMHYIMAAGVALKRVQIQNCVGLCHAMIDMHFFVVPCRARHRQKYRESTFPSLILSWLAFILTMKDLKSW